ncbi:DNA glycosylase [Stenotrophomonas ginsengisoli]|uniref:Adenine DNA glycosylase n=1 Tax=Stenotrophomonas ginsengisoli TaxID=336566 RepID=A0A0R0DHC8_9GAMM|nr:A/G-specific adenine glycosylase [Stenotrophomonas ginsengisoli]KRG78146.1 DNA glycosylase [Stenotrophomonas ginsengisoli]
MSSPALLPSKLLPWFDQHGRHDLPWQHPRTPYRVWLSEVMLQQTQVATVVPYFLRFVARFPDIGALAAADADTLMAHWAGLGYYARARNLQAAARRCVEQHEGQLPRDLDALVALPGIGRSTAAAILSQAWGDTHAILDGNVKRVLTRVYGIDGHPGQPAVEKQLWAIAGQQLAAVPAGRMTDWTQAQMDFGATLCSRAKPACALCPLQGQCIALRDGRVAELPTRKASKTLPEREAHALLIDDGRGRYALLRRPEQGIWAGLWTLPQADTHAALAQWTAQQLGADLESADALPDIVHTFSHYRLHLHLHRLRLPAAGRNAAIGENAPGWFGLAELAELGLPAPIRKLIDTL